MITQTYSTQLNQECQATYTWTTEGSNVGILLNPAGFQCTVTINEEVYTSGTAYIVCTATCSECSSTKKYPIIYITA